MGEIQGSIWVTGLFIMLFGGMTMMLFWTIDLMEYNAEVLAIEDNFRSENFDYILSLSNDYNICSQSEGLGGEKVSTYFDENGKLDIEALAITTNDCTGIVCFPYMSESQVDELERLNPDVSCSSGARYIKYNLVYEGMRMNRTKQYQMQMPY